LTAALIDNLSTGLESAGGDFLGLEGLKLERLEMQLR